MALGVTGQEREALRQSSALLGDRHVRKEVHHDLGYGHTRPPTFGAVGRPEGEAHLHDVSR